MNYLYILLFLLGCYGALVATWTFYLAAMSLKRVKGNLHGFAKFNAYLVMLPAVIIDVVFNLTVGSLMFVQIPKQLLFTDRLKLNKKGTGWRKKLAFYLCDNMLNQFDPSPKGHC